MVDRLKDILARVQAWWNKFTARQKSVIVGIAAAVVLAFAIIIYTVSKPDYSELIVCKDTAEASEVTDILDSAGFEYRTSTNALTIEVRTGDLPKASLALGSAGYVPESYDYDKIMSSGLTSTATDSNRRYQELLEKKFASDLSSLENISEAKVRLHIPDQDGTLVRQAQESSAYVTLTVDSSFTEANASAVARMIATALGNETTANITIVDNNANLLFTGGDDYTAAGIANSNQELQNQAEEMVANRVKNVFYGTRQYSNVEVSSHLPVDYAQYEQTIKNYTVAEGRDEAYMAHEDHYESTTENGVGGVPGTTSNDDDLQTNVYSDNNNSNSEVLEYSKDYLPNEDITHILTNSGAINYSQASIAVTAIRYREIREEDVKRQGLLEDSGLTWEEYKLANAGDTKLEVDEEYYALVANATGIDQDAVTIIAYESPVFVDEAGFSVNGTTVWSVIVFLLIIALLAFVVLRTMFAGRAAEEKEEDLSVEGLLQSTPEQELEDIDVENKSEARKIVEKFVDENPESAAALLRNWLNEDWG